jgi:pantoate--beta-alanine ligase
MPVTHVLTSPGDVRAWSDDVRCDGGRVALVATMGALHVGHDSLVSLANEHADRVLVSIFVNPLQFDRDTDFDAYLRPIDDDVARCKRLGVDAVYAPTASAMYPAGFETTVTPGALADSMEGAARPGHFAGVTTVVTKLFAAVRPDVAVFGEKDFQQLAVLRRMTADLDLGVEIVAAPTVRESDGLALSSRNQRLSDEQRFAAVSVPRALDAAVVAARAGERSSGPITAAAMAVLERTPLARPEYVTVFDPETCQPLDAVAAGARIATAVWFGDVRLIDNRAL